MKRCPKCGKTYADEANFCPTDAGHLVAAEAPAPAASASGTEAAGLVGGRFELGPVLGGSLTGPVHRATDAQGGAAVAVKLVDPAVVAIPQVAQRIERELKQLERVQHRAVARVIASGKHADRVFVATELVEGGRPLGELVAASGPVDAQRASELVLAIGEGLIEAAKVGVVHRDLSPKNVLVTRDDIKLVNFAVPTPGDGVPGVVEFVAPEAIEGKPVDQRSNIYSLGAIFYFLLTGRGPYAGAAGEVKAAHLAGGPQPPSAHAAVPADIDALVVRALERNAAKRFLTLRQFLDDVDRVARGPEGGVGSTAPFGRANAGKSKELAQTLMGFGFGNEAKTRQMDVQIPPEAMREAAALDAAVAQAAAASPPPNLGETAMGVPAAPAPGAAPVAAPEPVPSLPAPAPAPAADSPWSRAAGAQQDAAAAVGAAVASAPASPMIPAAPKLAGGASGKKKADEAAKDKGSKGKFRETMWFKKGELDAAAAEEAAAAGDATAAGKADLLPIEERYSDDGTITRGDAEKYSLKTGATSMMQAVRDGEVAPSASVSERELVGEMKGGRNLVIIAIVIGVLAVIGIAVAFLAA